jgi:hypothetical protein
LAKRQFTIDTGKERIPAEAQVHGNVAIKYLMKRRRSLLMTNSKKVEKLSADQQKKIKIIGKQVSREHRVNWEQLGSEEFEGSHFAFTLEDLDEKSTKIVICMLSLELSSLV